MPRDRIEAELRVAAAGLGAADLASMAGEAFQKLLARAGMRRQSPTIVRVADQIEVVNPVEIIPGSAIRGCECIASRLRLRHSRICAPP